MQLSDIPTWSGWIVASILGVPAAIYYSRRLLQERRSERLRVNEDTQEILKLVRNLATYAEQYDKYGTRIPLSDFSSDWFDARPWLKQGVRNKLLKLQSLATDFEFWLKISKDLVAATMFQAAYYEGTFSELTSIMDKTGKGQFSDLLLNHLQYYVLAGQQISVPWLRDNISSLHGEMMKAGSEDNIKKVIEPIRQAAENDCLQMMREKRQQLMEEARQTVGCLETMTR